MRDSKAGKEAKAAFDKEVEAKSSVVEQKRKALENVQQDFIKKRSVMNESQRRAMAESVKKKQTDFRRMEKDITDELQRKGLELERNILKDIEAIVNDIGKKEGFDLIMERNAAGIIYGSESANITQKIISAYDASPQ